MLKSWAWSGLLLSGFPLVCAKYQHFVDCGSLASGGSCFLLQCLVVPDRLHQYQGRQGRLSTVTDVPHGRESHKAIIASVKALIPAFQSPLSLSLSLNGWCDAASAGQ